MEDSADSSKGLLLFSALGAAVWLYHNNRRHKAPQLVQYEGGCHCEAVKFRVLAPYHLTVWNCDCSICLMKKNAHFVVPAQNFTLISGENDLSSYRFNTRKAKHLFCKHCGVQSYYVRFCATGIYLFACNALRRQVPRSNPDGVGVTLACVRGVKVRLTLARFNRSMNSPNVYIFQSYEVKDFNGQNWENFIGDSGIQKHSKQA